MIYIHLKQNKFKGLLFLTYFTPKMAISVKKPVFPEEPVKKPEFNLPAGSFN
jgi:hypothetical protein